MEFRFGARLARRALVGVAFASVAMLAACGGDSSGTDGDVYTLRSVGGNTLPYDDGFGDITKSGSLTLSGGNRFNFRIAGTYDDGTGPANYSGNASGTYVLDAATGDMTFTATRVSTVYDGQTFNETLNPPETDVGTKSGTTITVDDLDLGLLVFSK